MIKVGKVGSNPLLIHGFFEHGRRELMTIFWSFWFAALPLCCGTSAWCQFISAGRLNISPPIGRAPGERVTILWIFENRAGVSLLPRKLKPRAGVSPLPRKLKPGDFLI